MNNNQFKLPDIDKNQFKLPDIDKNQFNSIKDKYSKTDIAKNKDDLASITNNLLTQTKKSTFENMGVSNKTLQDLTKVINDSNNCDSECKNKRKLNDSRDTLMLAIQILNGSPSFFDVSLKNFLINKHGKAGYVDHIIDNATTNIDNFIKQQENMNNNLQKLIKNMVINYSYNVQYLENIDSTLNNSRNNLHDVDDRINQYTNLVNLDSRTNFFTSNDINSLRNYNFYITILYYIIVTFTLFFKNFFNNFKVSQNFKENFNFTNLFLIIILFILLFLPIIIKIGIIIIIKFYEKFLQFLNIRKFTQSYRDIIMEDR
tara:strand:+ start:1214 stop:2161 length:948 start_codon:yes stop_codon:yes gene_type:complete